jgi:hypothetical protein
MDATLKNVMILLVLWLLSLVAVAAGMFYWRGEQKEKEFAIRTAQMVQQSPHRDTTKLPPKPPTTGKPRVDYVPAPYIDSAALMIVTLERDSLKEVIAELITPRNYTIRPVEGMTLIVHTFPLFGDSSSYTYIPAPEILIRDTVYLVQPPPPEDWYNRKEVWAIGAAVLMWLAAQ